ncbi:MAG: M20 family metallo-hydrolase [Burkholderiaceae bacterium]
MNENPLEQQAALTVQDHVDSERLRTAIARLAEFGGREDGGVTRQTLSEIDLASRRFLIDRARALGCSVEVDECANLFFRRPGLQDDLPPVLTGSHGDTQPVGGKLDGAYGVLAGLEIIEALNDAGVRTRKPVEVVAWTNEEGSRFGPGCMGSSAYVDPSRLQQYRQSLDGDKMNFGDAVDRALKEIPDVPLRPQKRPLDSYIELHIEQGPVLENAGVTLGVVTGIQSVRWYTVKVTGMAAHAGTTPMDLRQDAMATAVQIAHRLYAEAAARAASPLRLTLGRWSVGPNSINTIPGEVEFSVDMRCVDDSVLADFDAAFKRIVADHPWHKRIEVACIFEREPTHFPQSMLAIIEDACSQTSERAGKTAPLRLTSGAFHDAMYLAGFCPTAMIFVPSKNGISHNATEDTDHDDLVIGVKALASAVARLAT